MDEQMLQAIQQLTAAVRELAEVVNRNTVTVKQLVEHTDRGNREIETLRVRVSQHMEATGQSVRIMHQLINAVEQNTNATQRSSYR